MWVKGRTNPSERPRVSSAQETWLKGAVAANRAGWMKAVSQTPGEGELRWAGRRRGCGGGARAPGWSCPSGLRHTLVTWAKALPRSLGTVQTSKPPYRAAFQGCHKHGMLLSRFYRVQSVASVLPLCNTWVLDAEYAAAGRSSSCPTRAQAVNCPRPSPSPVARGYRPLKVSGNEKSHVRACQCKQNIQQKNRLSIWRLSCSCSS